MDKEAEARENIRLANRVLELLGSGNGGVYSTEQTVQARALIQEAVRINQQRLNSCFGEGVTAAVRPRLETKR